MADSSGRNIWIFGWIFHAGSVRARITRAVPRDPTGASIDLGGWRDRFETHTAPVEAARVNLFLDEIPVYVEPLGS